jgi:hypothetical protein
MKKINDLIANCNFEDAVLGQIEVELNNLTELPVILKKIEMGRAIYRCRPNEPKKMFESDRCASSGFFY